MGIISRLANSKVGRVGAALSGGTAVFVPTYEMLNPPGVHAFQQNRHSTHQIKVVFDGKTPIVEGIQNTYEHDLETLARDSSGTFYVVEIDINAVNGRNNNEIGLYIGNGTKMRRAKVTGYHKKRCPCPYTIEFELDGRRGYLQLDSNDNHVAYAKKKMPLEMLIQR